MHRYSIMPFDTNHVEEICKDIKDQYEMGAADLALFMFKLVPEGDPVIPKAEQQVEKYIIFRDRLAEMGLKCGALVQCSIGHGYKLSAYPPFQQLIGLADNEKKYTTCPYDKGFQDYIRHSLKVIAEAKPEVIMIDDDFRLIQRSYLGCVCPDHMKAIEELNGAPLTRERIHQAVLGDSAEDKRITDIFVKTQIDSLLESARAMREGIDLVDKKLQGIYCTCGISAEGAAEIANILAGEGNPVIVRVNNGNYSPMGARYLTVAYQRAAIEVTVMRSQGKVDYFLAETDTCPQNRYSTGAQSLHSHYTGTILEGISGAKHWITRLGEFEPNAGKAYRKILGKHTKFYDKLAEIVPTLKWRGCRAPLSTVPDYCFKGYDNSSALNDWVKCVLERLGLPVYYSAEQGGAAFLERNGTENFTDDEMKEMLSGTLVLDGFAAKNLCNRGLGEYIGADIREWNGATRSIERICATDKKVGNQVAGMEIVPVPDARIESMVYNIPDGKTEVPLFPGSVLYKNSLGGTVLTFSGSAKANFVYTEAFSFLNESRKAQFIKFLKETNDLPVYYPDDAEVYLKAADTPDGETFVAFFNIGFDPIENITLVSEKPVTKIEKLNCNGEREEVSFKLVDGVLELDCPAYTLDPVILFLK